jgi:hypothetical protein
MSTKRDNFLVESENQMDYSYRVIWTTVEIEIMEDKKKLGKFSCDA